MKENMVKQLELIQGIINRMSNNSFALKGWAVTLVAAIFALAAKDANQIYFFVAYIPIIIFWGLDSYYLKIERKYINLYNYVRLQKDEDVDFDMDLSRDFCNNDKTQYATCLLTSIEVGFYIPLAIVCGGVTIILLG